MFIDIKEAITTTGKGSETIRRFIRANSKSSYIKKNSKGRWLLDDEFLYRKYPKQNDYSNDNQPNKKSTLNSGEDVITLTIETLRDQLKAKDDQIERLQKLLHNEQSLRLPQNQTLDAGTIKNTDEVIGSNEKKKNKKKHWWNK
jgi:hypothetical protein